jgi:DNA-binding NarL/FixJ family response regulator
MESSLTAQQLTSSLRVLIVDDEPLFQEMVQAMLEAEEGIDVVGRAQDGRKAVELAGTLDPDVILMDVSMPVMNGIEATEVICRDSSACVLILTGGSNLADIDRARKAGAAGYLTKDRIASDLVDDIRSVAAR